MEVDLYVASTSELNTGPFTVGEKAAGWVKWKSRWPQSRTGNDSVQNVRGLYRCM